MLTLIKNYLKNRDSYKHWNRVGIFPHHGFCIMLSSLRSKDSCGIGEYLDLIPLITFMGKTGMDTLQLLPLTDSAEDQSPYNAISSVALNPTFLSLWDLPGIEEQSTLKAALSKLQQKLKNLSYQKIRTEKQLFLWDYFLLFFSDIAKTREYQTFVETNPWLYEYSLYLILRKKNGHLSWQMWPEAERNAEKELFNLTISHKQEMDFHFLLQYLCFSQMKKVRSFAEDCYVRILGDLPILLSSDSADSWFYQEMFSFNQTAGAPPDMYNSQGQSWGFPLLLWDKAKELGWWKKRLHAASLIYHMYRIDHVVGFFRIWGVHAGEKAKEGSFVSDNRYIWPFDGKERLQMLLEESLLLPIAEDLGTIPPETYAVLKELGTGYESDALA
jgi:4-alpha-glucanotransferase